MIARLLNRGGILQRTLLTVMTPLLAVVIVLGYHFTTANMKAARDAMNAHGEFTARHLAALSEFEVFSRNIEALESNANSILHEPGVAGIKIVNSRGETLLRMSKPSGHDKERKHLVAFTAPVVRTGVTVTDYLDEAEEQTGQTENKIIGKVTVHMTDEDVVRRQRTIVISGTVITLLGLLLSFLLALYVARSVTRPISQLTNTVAHLTGGDLESRTPEVSAGELGTLEKGINQMASTLQESQERLVNEVDEATRTLLATVNELERRNTELNRAKAEAEMAGTAKAEFLASMSHEIRTPLSAVIGYSQLLEKMDQTEEQQEYTRIITQAASQLLVIIDDILRFTRLEAEKPRLDRSVMQLHERLENILSIQAPAAYDKQLELVLLIHSDVPETIVSDANRIGQVLTNLVANAIKFTNQGHIITEVSLKESGNESDLIEISVSDTGIGMNDDEVQRVFQPFTQADASTSKMYGGTGLGLAISKQLVELIGGTIGVTSKPGKGSRFWFTIPTVHFDNGDAGLPLPLSDTRILVYERNAFSRRAIRNRLFSWGATVFNSGRWVRMLEMLASARGEQRPYDLVVLGLSIQEYGGRLVTEILEDIRNTDDIPILLLIGAEAQHLSTKNLGLGRVKLISKPPRSERMLRAIQALLPVTGTVAPVRPIPRHMDTPPAAGRLTGLRVLVAEDNEFNQGLIRRLLEAMGVSVTLAANGKLACELAADTRYDLILMDIHMPEVGGIEACNTIRTGKNLDTPIVALSADVFACEEQLDCGLMQACITKPVTQEKLADILQQWAAPVARGSGAVESSAPMTASTIPDGMEQELYAELRAQLAGLRAACMADDQAAVRDHLHQLKGISDYFQLEDFRSGCETLYRAAAGNDLEAMISSLDRLDALLTSQGG